MVFFCVASLVSGCSHGKGLRKPQSHGGIFSSVERAKPAPVVEALPEADLGDGKPMVKVIRGKEVPDMEAARSLLGEAEYRVEGLGASIDHLYLKGVTVRTLAEIMTELSGYNVVASNEVAAKQITLFLKNLTFREAIETLCRLNNLWYREGRQVVTLMTEAEYTKDMVSRKNESTRAFYVRYTNAADMAKIIAAAMGDQVVLAAVKNEKVYGYLEEDDDPDVSVEKTERAVNLAEGAGLIPVSRILAEDGGEGGRHFAKIKERHSERLAVITVSKRNNCVVARSVDEAILTEIGKIIEALDTPTNQVLLEMKILQVTLGDKFESFFQMDYEGKGNPGAGGKFFNQLVSMPGLGLSSTTAGYLFANNKLNARVQFFQSQSRADIIATPFLMCANNSSVEFFVGEETPLRDEVTTKTVTLGESENTVTTFEVKIKREELGTDVTIATFINEDNTITLDIDTEISSANLNMTQIGVVNEETGEVVPFPLDGINTNKIKSIVCARSDQSIAIGGIIREVDNVIETKVPILGDIPFLGMLFKKKIDHKTKTETVIILTPHIITHPALAGKTTERFLKRKSSHPQITRGEENLLKFELQGK
ncbi:hypothetical protein [Desulfoluna sp.]|uniref:type II secretion system protein GspD n=1 Tax=Desulfoluna sp. TaxID=2045199 RepID=UPI002620EDDD|nr:hypothetical protein [Desulfoluna sp.]